jgi:hypothetical protein
MQITLLLQPMRISETLALSASRMRDERHCSAAATRLILVMNSKTKTAREFQT